MNSSPDSPWAIVTVVTSNYLHFTRALAMSVREVHPEARIIACVIGEPPRARTAEDSLYEVIPFDRLVISQARRFLFQYTAMELTCALKSYVMLHLFKTTGLRRLLYFDSDVQVYGPLSELLAQLEKHNAVLTPHLTRPKSLAAPDRWEMDILDTGVFNGGFVGFQRTETSLDILEWWRQRVEKWCKAEISQHDQKWLNGLPALFDGIQVERSPGYNAAPWNTADRNFREDAQGRITVDGKPMVFFHYASFEPGQSKVLSRVSRRPLHEESTVVQGLFHRYASRLQACGQAEFQGREYEHARLADGSMIQPEWRELIRTGHPALAQFEDPFCVPPGVYRHADTWERWKRTSRRLARGLGFGRLHRQTFPGKLNIGQRQSLPPLPQAK